MNYEERYNNAVESIKRIYDQADSYGRELMEKEFPELRESEDERIRKEIVQFLQLPHPQFVGKRNYEEWIAWLEKQGEQHSWSKEDEHCVELLLTIIDSSSLIPKNRKKCKEFLKSLKPNHWKPSKEQMSMLLAVLNDSNNITAESVHIALKSLYNDIKKL